MMILLVNKKIGKDTEGRGCDLFMVILLNLSEWLDEHYETSVRTTDLRTDIRTRDIANKKQVC
jgi:hypothetical protein